MFLKVTDQYGEVLTAKYLNEIPAGEYFKRKPDAKTVFKKEHYLRGEKKFCCCDTDDMNREIFLKSKTVVYIGFTY